MVRRQLIIRSAPNAWSLLKPTLYWLRALLSLWICTKPDQLWPIISHEIPESWLCSSPRHRKPSFQRHSVDVKCINLWWWEAVMHNKSFFSVHLAKITWPARLKRLKWPALPVKIVHQVDQVVSMQKILYSNVCTRKTWAMLLVWEMIAPPRAFCLWPDCSPWVNLNNFPYFCSLWNPVLCTPWQPLHY